MNLWHDGKKAFVVMALTLGAIGSIPLVFLTPPFQVPDEQQHFYRAYQLSEFHIRAEVQNGEAGGTLPKSLPQLVKASIGTLDPISCKYPARSTPMMKTLQLRSIPLDPSARQFVAFPGSAFYSPLAYLPQAIGVVLGRALGFGPLYLFYAARLMNCLSALGLLGVAVFFMPFAEELVFFAGLLPMSLYLYASLSADADVIGSALVFTALAISAGARGHWKGWELWIAAAVAVVFCSIKPVYAPILLAAAVPEVFRSGKPVKVIRQHLLLLAVAMGTAAGWLLFAKSTMTTPPNGSHPSAQINLVLHDPAVLLRVLLNSLHMMPLISFYIEGVGVFGWLTVLLRPAIVYAVPLLSIFLLWRFGVRSPLRRSATTGLWHMALSLASSSLVVIALFLMWSQLGQVSVPTAQGRYFIPILVLASMGAMELFPSRRPASPRWQSMAIIVAAFVLEVAALDTTIIQAFRVF